MTTSLPSWRAGAAAGISLSAAMTRAGVSDIRPARSDAGRLNPALGRILLPSAYGRWHSETVEQYTPQRIEYVLQYGLSGDLTGQWRLFDLMEDTWPRLAKNLGEIKRSVGSMQWTVKPWAEDDAAPTPEAEERAKLVSHVLWRMQPRADSDERDFIGLINDLMDAWGKGLSVCELMWEAMESTAMGRHLGLRAAQWVHPDFYAFNGDGRLGLRTEAYVGRGGVEEFPEHKFLVASAKARTAHMSAAALLRPLAWWWAASNFSATWLLNYAQLFGIPMRWANYSESASQAQVDKIGAALAGMGSAAWAMFPEGTSLSILEGTKTAGSSPQESVLDRADKLCDLLVLGQTLTSDAADRGTQALGTVHERVRGDVISTAADWVAGIIGQQLIPSIIALNYDDAEMVPEIEALPVRVEDQQANAERDAILFDKVPMPESWFYERHKIPMPKPGEKTIGGGGANSSLLTPHSALPKTPQDEPEGSGGDKTPDGSQKTTAQSPPRPSVDSGEVEARRGEDDPAARIAARRAEVLGKAYRGAMAPFRAAILASTSPEDAIERLRTIYLDWTPERLLAETESAFQLCAAAGAAGDGK